MKLCDFDIKKRFVILMFFKIAPQRVNRVKYSALLRAGHKVSEVAKLVVLALLSTRSRSAWTTEGVNKRAGSGRKSVVNRYSLRDEMTFEGRLRMASRKLSRSTTVFRPLHARLLIPSLASMRSLIA